LRKLRLIPILAAAGCLLAFHADARWDPLQKAERAAQRGSELMAAGDSLAAVQAYLQAQALAPEDGRIRMGLAEAFYQNGEFKSAHDQYRATSESEPAWAPDARYNAGNAAFSMGEYQRALEHYTQAIVDGSTDPDLLYNLELTQRILEQAQSEPSEQQQDEDGEPQEGDEQQQEQQQQQQGEQEQQQEQEQQSEESEGEQEEENQEESSDEEEQQPPTAPPDSTQAQASADSTITALPPGMTPEQAMRLLDALDHDEEQLRRSIQRRLRRGSEENEHDW